MRQMSASYSPSLPCHLLACCILSCHHVHCIIMFSKLASVRVLPVLSVVRSESGPLARARRPSQTLFLYAGVKLSRYGPRFANRPWYSTGRPPVKFRAIWRSFDTPTVIRVTRTPPFLFAAQHPSKLAQNPSNSPPSPRSFDHDRVAENRSAFGLS